VLWPGGTYFAQHVGPATVFELVEYFLGPQPQVRTRRHPDVESAEARAAGLEVVDVRLERLRVEFLPPDRVTLWQDTVAGSRSLVAEALADGGLERLARRTWPDGRAPSLRWIRVHTHSGA